MFPTVQVIYSDKVCLTSHVRIWQVEDTDISVIRNRFIEVEVFSLSFGSWYVFFFKLLFVKGQKICYFGHSSEFRRQYGGSTAAVLRQYGGSTAAVRRQYCGSTAAVPRQYGGSTAAVPRQCHGSAMAV